LRNPFHFSIPFEGLRTAIASSELTEPDSLPSSLKHIMMKVIVPSHSRDSRSPELPELQTPRDLEKPKVSNPNEINDIFFYQLLHFSLQRLRIELTSSPPARPPSQQASLPKAPKFGATGDIIRRRSGRTQNLIRGSNS